MILPYWTQENLEKNDANVIFQHLNLAIEIFRHPSSYLSQSILMFGRTWHFLERDKQPFSKRITYMSVKHPAAGLREDEQDWTGVVRVADEALRYLVPNSNVLRY